MAGHAGVASPPGLRGPASRYARVGDPATAPSRRSFAVEVCVGRKIAGWPPGRFDFSADGLQVRLHFPWLVTRSAGKDAITCISVSRIASSVWCVRFEDSGQRLADVHVHLPLHAQRIIDKLSQCGYTLIDRETSQRVVRLAKR
jgi:hypothetical protein